MKKDPKISVFMGYLGLFTFFMLLLVSSNNLLQLFLGWEGVGLTSYLLIGFWNYKDSANSAAIKAFVVNRVGDFGLLMALFTIFVVFGTLNINEIMILVNSYSDTYFDFITETLTTNERFTIELEKYVTNPPTPEYKQFFNEFKTIFITEKLWRSIFYKRPFIVMGNHRTLEYLKVLGFKTFDCMWREEYDTIESPNLREDACLELLKDICNTNTLETMHKKVYSEEVQLILQHNYDLFKSLAEDINLIDF